MVTHKGALNEPEEARALCWCRRRAQGTLAREERLPGGRPDRLDAEVGYSGKHGMSGDGAPGPLVARSEHAMGAPARWRCAERHRSWDRPLYGFRGGLRGAGASSTESKIAANIERGF